MTPNAHSHSQVTRLKTKPVSGSRGHVDGAWWPRSNDLTTELPELLAATRDRMGPIERVVFHRDDWEPSSLRLQFDGHKVRLDGYRFRDTGTIDIRGIGGSTHMTLLIAGSNLSESSANALMDRASDPADE